MEEELNRIENQLRVEEWRWQVTQIIAQIPSGYLVTYGRVAEIANQTYGLNIGARNVAWLRKHLYGLLTHNTQVPLHRIAKIGDVHSFADSKETKSLNDKLREQEGSLTNPLWLRLSAADQLMAMNRWNGWRQFPDPRVGGYLLAPFGPGVYELRNLSTGELILCGYSKNVANRMSSILPASLGTGARKNFHKKQYVLNHLAEIEYRTMACPDKDVALAAEKQLRSGKTYRFPT